MISKHVLSVEETQKISLDILVIITNICEKLNLRYFLFYGTLIGAVRHHGFIPWDDDVDIMMPRPDYDALLGYLSLHIQEYKNLEVFNHDLNPKYPYMITRVSNAQYRILMKNEKEYGMGVFIDIYPFDGLGNTEVAALKYGKKGDRLSSLCYQATRNHYAVETTTSSLKKILKFPAFLWAKICGKDVFQKKLNQLARMVPYDTTKYVGCIVWLSGGEKDIFPREWFDDYVMLSFEKKKFRVPKHYDDFLKLVYGDYMKLPPKHDQVGHHNYKVVTK